MRRSILLLLLKEFYGMHSITSISKELGTSRVGVWKVVKKLEEDELIKVEPVGFGKTSTYIIRINWDSTIIEKTLALYLSEEAESRKDGLPILLVCKTQQISQSFLAVY